MSPVTVSRRAFLTSAGTAGAALAAPTAPMRAQRRPALARPDAPPARVASDEAYWRRVAAQYRTAGTVTNLEGGYWGMMPVPVAGEYARQVERVNAASSYDARRSGLAHGDCVRVTPALYNKPEDLDRLVAALRQMS